MRSDHVTKAVAVAATVTTGLLAGLYFAYACSVMPGLGRTGDATFTAAMTSINDAIVNPVFMVAFAGAPLLTAFLAVLRRAGRNPWVIAALVLHVVAFAVTAGVSVPLNDDLARTGDREAFEDAWIVWNVVRTVAVTGALACLTWRLVAGATPAAVEPGAASGSVGGPGVLSSGAATS